MFYSFNQIKNENSKCIPILICVDFSAGYAGFIKQDTVLDFSGN